MSPAIQFAPGTEPESAAEVIRKGHEATQRKLDALDHALRWCDDHADVRDGGEDGPRPNDAMMLQMDLEAIIEGRQ